MSDRRKPQKHDLVMGGNNPPPVDGVVLGGIAGVKNKFDRNNIEPKTLSIFEEALKYGKEGEDWLYEILEKETGETQWIAALLLSEIANKPYKKLFYKPKKKLKSNQIVGVIRKDSNKVVEKKDDLEIILNLVPTKREKQLVFYYENLILSDCEQWNAWKIKYPDFMLYLRGIDLNNADLEYIDLSKSNLVNANLEGTNLQEAIFNKSCLCNTNLNKADLDETYLIEVDLRQANLEGANLTSQNILDCNFGRANLKEARLEGCFTGSNFSGADFSNASLIYSDLRDVIIDKTNFYATNFRRANVSGLDFKGLNIQEANFARSIRNKTNFKGAYFQGAHFSDDYYEPGWE